jgi:hypothetical protein
MNEIKYCYSNETINQLALLVGQKLQLIYANRFINEYQSNFLEASCLVLNCGKGNQLKVAIAWFQCDTSLESFYKITAGKTEFDVDYNTSIYSFGNTSKISRVLLITKKLQIDDQDIEHSLGVIIEREDGKRILIVGGESALQNLILTDDDEFISNIIINTVITEVK